MATEVSFKFDGKRALVTGAGRGIGRAIAIALAKAGAETYALSKTQENLDSLVKECPSIHPVQVDLADWSATRQAVEKLPPLDFLVNNAGVASRFKFVDVSPEEFDRVYDIHVKSVLNVSQVVAKKMIERGSPGSIVNMSSINGVRAIEGRAIYGSSKAALDQLTRVMTLELGPHKIRVNSVNPTVVMTEMGRYWENTPQGDALKKRTPCMQNFFEVEEVIGPVLFLLSDAASMISGVTLMADGGFTVT